MKTRYGAGVWAQSLLIKASLRHIKPKRLDFLGTKLPVSSIFSDQVCGCFKPWHSSFGSRISLLAKNRLANILPTITFLHLSQPACFFQALLAKIVKTTSGTCLFWSSSQEGARESLGWRGRKRRRKRRQQMETEGGQTALKESWRSSFNKLRTKKRNYKREKGV